MFDHYLINCFFRWNADDDHFLIVELFFYQMPDSNPGRLGGQRECHLCAMCGGNQVPEKFETVPEIKSLSVVDLTYK